MTASSVRMVFMTTPDVETGRSLARALVDARLAACGNVVTGVESVYRWQGEVRTDSEALVILKTSVDRVHEMMQRAQALHPYDVPELLAVSVAEGAAEYVDWVVNETGAS